MATLATTIPRGRQTLTFVQRNDSWVIYRVHTPSRAIDTFEVAHVQNPGGAESYPLGSKAGRSIKRFDRLKDAQRGLNNAVKKKTP